MDHKLTVLAIFLTFIKSFDQGKFSVTFDADFKQLR